MSRTDIHRPSVIVPADYDYVGMECVKIECLGDAEFAFQERQRIAGHMQRTGGTYSRHAHGGNCHVCGASAIYAALFYHKPTNVYVRTGTDCADKLEWDSGEGEAFRQKVRAAIERKAGKAKAQAILEASDLAAAWAVFVAAPAEADRREESTIRDIVGKLVHFGSISDAQANFLRKLVDAIGRRAEIDARRAAENAAAAPVPVTEERIAIQGKVLSIKRPNIEYGEFATRTLVQHADGWKVWGTLPTSIEDAAIGDTVEFSAKIKPSDRDPKFGFFSRPTKARKVEISQEAA